MNSAVVWTVGSFLGGPCPGAGRRGGARLDQWPAADAALGQAGADPVRASDTSATMGGRDCQNGDCRRPYRGGSDELAEQR